jgi:hypothetical protein
MNEDYVVLSDVIENRESNPELYQAWDIACREQIGCDLDTFAGEMPIAVPERGFPYHVKFMGEEAGVELDESWPPYLEEAKENYGVIEVNGETHYYGGDYPAYIIYFAGFQRELFTTAEAHMKFCHWARRELLGNFRDYNVAVRAGLGLSRIVHIPGEGDPGQCVTNDDERRDKIMEFCAQLFERYDGPR